MKTPAQLFPLQTEWNSSKKNYKVIEQESLPLPLSVLLTRLKFLERPSLSIVAALRIRPAGHLQCITVDETSSSRK